MLIACGIGLILINILYLCTIPYKKTFRKKLNRKEHKLLALYGLSMFIADRFPKKFRDKKGAVDKAIKELKVKENVQKEKYLYLGQKISISLLVIIVTLVIGVVAGMMEKLQTSESIKELKRDSSKITTYKFVAEKENGQQEAIAVDINSRELTDEEVYELLESMEEPLVKEVLGENESTEKVSKPLNLVSSIGNGISVTWDISDSSIINYDGEISESASKEGSIVTLTANMMRNNISTEYSFFVNVFPPSDEKSLQQQLQEYVNENNKYDEKVKLPESISGQTVRYFSKTQNSYHWIILAGVVGAVAIFILKDQDLKKEVKKRNHQMTMDYPEIVGEILLYYNAGLSFKLGIERIVANYEKEKHQDRNLFRYAYEELEVALRKMKSGISEVEAINEYGSRCGLHCYIKLAGIIEQNLRRGSREVSYALKNELNNAMFERKNTALKEGGEMSTKLLGPMVVMLIISIVIIMVPALWSMNI